MVSNLISFAAGVVVSFLSAILVYSVRQYWEKTKLESALLEEVDKMRGIEDWATQTDSIKEPPTRQIQPDDVPPVESIPTTVYESSAAKLGLLQGPIDRFQDNDKISPVVSFYSRALRAKGIIRDISSGADVSNTAQEDLYDIAEPLQKYQEEISDKKEFVSIDDEDFDN